MARKKTITRDHILNAAYNLVIAEGFKRFTARNIAASMGCSTQPIYLEFANMADLRQAVVDRIKSELTERFQKTYTDDPLIDMALTYIDFAIENNSLYQSVFVEDHLGVDDMRQFAMSAALKRLDKYDSVKNLTETQKNNVITGAWIVATGIADLMSAGFIHISHAQMIDILQSVLKDFIENKRFSEVDDDNIVSMARAN
ncbi:TetR/AcrR family transcriptional regulator [Lacticaseibacillus pantheris]|jgi:AcrR family transcriptional regulator|uniref:Transcriptional regulator n=1 Tax=Lacticaseibacillus pantheris DSM 15945 = JCM 12539 = NBRC 106106 TaxID=1423783 RepID=A0A0R1U522_9LACO|nr:TetR/AcrR family transcriptional regulator [Lacticaseibacillus pantheris]KRL86082.1 Transcriptional regulator [Lacticaseibacillus pantheris DSM 15945 = JCM 12539 = NBRC 106106]